SFVLQAEDGIRDRNVTGVQTCALPIYSYNQHMHVLVCVEPTYFKNTENYVNQKQWIQFWKKAMKLDYDPNVKVQMIRPKNKYKSDIQSAIDETATYPVKDTDFM